MKILIIPSAYPNSENNIRGIFVQDQVEILEKAGHIVIVAYPELWSIKDKYKEKAGMSKKIENNIITYRFKGYNYLPRISRIRKVIYQSRLLKLFKKIHLEHPDIEVIHAHSLLWGGISSLYISRKYKIPLVITEHSSAFGRGLIREYESKLLKLNNNKIEKLICVSEHLKKDLIKYLPNLNEKKILVVPNVVRFDKKNDLPKNNKKNKFRFITVCIIKKNKNIDILIQAFYKVFSQNKEVELIIVGDGSEKRKLMGLVKHFNLDEQVIFKGMLEKKEVYREMRDSNVFVLPSQYETFGVVYIEALYCGLPVIATKCGGPEGFINENNGLLIEHSVDDLAHGLTNIYSSYEKYNQENIKKEAIETFSEKIISDQLINIYKDVIYANESRKY